MDQAKKLRRIFLACVLACLVFVLCLIYSDRNSVWAWKKAGLADGEEEWKTTLQTAGSTPFSPALGRECKHWKRTELEDGGEELMTMLRNVSSRPLFPDLGRPWDWCNVEWRPCSYIQSFPIFPFLTPSPPPSPTPSPSTSPSPFPPFLLRPVFSPSERLVMLFNLQILHQLFTENNVTYFLVAGTLLGSLRHHGFIPWDDDIDFFVSQGQMSKALEVIKICRSCGVVNSGSHHKFFVRGFHGGKTPKGVIHWPFIDIYFYSKNRTHLHNVEEMTFARDDIFPLSRGPFEGAMLPVPRHPLAVLASTYTDFNINMCVSTKWCHKNFYRNKEIVRVPCQDLKEFYFFVKTSPD